MVTRIAITLPDKIAKRLDTWSRIFAKGSQEGNRSACIADLVERYIPNTSKLVS